MQLHVVLWVFTVGLRIFLLSELMADLMLAIQLQVSFIFLLLKKFVELVVSSKVFAYGNYLPMFVTLFHVISLFD